jgi:hypothetical protein
MVQRLQLILLGQRVQVWQLLRVVQTAVNALDQLARVVHATQALPHIVV